MKNRIKLNIQKGKEKEKQPTHGVLADILIMLLEALRLVFSSTES